MFGIEQEFFFYDTRIDLPLGMRKNIDNKIIGYLGPQGPYYCGVGTGKIFGRDLFEKALDNVLYCKLDITGLNFEVAPGQCEYQLCEKGIKAADDLIVLDRVLIRTVKILIWFVNFHPKPIKNTEGDWNGSGCRIEF